MIFWEIDIRKEKETVLNKVKETGLLFNPNKEFIDQINFNPIFIFINF